MTMDSHVAMIIKEQEFDPATFETKNVADGVDVTSGKLKRTGVVVPQSYAFDHVKLTPYGAEKWLKKNEVTVAEFVAAKEEAEEIPVVGEIKAGARHSARDMELIRKAHSSARDIVKHMKELGGMAYKSEDEDGLEDWASEWKTV